MAARELTVRIDAQRSVDGLLDAPEDAWAGYVFAHGAGAGVRHAFMASLAHALADRGVAVLGFQFPFTQAGGKRPDPPALAQAAVRAAVDAAADMLPGLPLFAGGKSFGGRMTSQAQAESPLARVRGLVFVGFPLHAAKQPATTRAAHLARVDVPMLFLQGTRDALADLALMREVTAPLAPRAELHEIEGADHAFHVPARSGRTDTQVVDELADTAAAWMRRVANA